MDLKKSNNYTLAPAEIVGKKRTKPRNWFRIFLNSLGGLFLLIVLGFALYRMWAYYSISKMTPRENVDFYLILDDSALENSENWQNLLALYIEKNSNLSPILWDSLLKANEYYLSIYQRDAESPLEFLFYLPELDASAQDLLKTMDIPFIYDGKFLLLNNTAYFENSDESTIKVLDFNILNRLAVGSYYNDYFILYEDNKKIIVDLPAIKVAGNSYKSYINYIELKDQLYFASNRVKWGDLSQYLPFAVNIPVSDNTSMDLAVYDSENSILGRDFSVVLKSISKPDEILESLEYLFAYNNRKIEEVKLSDDSVIEEELLDFGKFAWQDENSYQKILISEEENIYLYSTLRDGNLILTSLLSDIEKLQNVEPVNLSHYHFMKSDFVSQLGPWFESMNYCENWTLKYNGFLQIESCE